MLGTCKALVNLEFKGKLILRICFPRCMSRHSPVALLYDFAARSHHQFEASYQGDFNTHLQNAELILGAAPWSLARFCRLMLHAKCIHHTPADDSKSLATISTFPIFPDFPLKP
jgi:hypothetical protein